MNLLILNGPACPRAARNLHYRGTYRAHPTYCDELPEDHEINKLFSWFLEEGGELGVVHDPVKALRYVELLNQRRLPNRNFEVIEVTDGDEPAHVDRELLGFDISTGYNYSLLWGGLATQTRLDASGVPRERSANAIAFPEPIRELNDLLARFYAPKLNRYSLFQKSEVASECLTAMDALQQLSPNLYEGGDLKPNFRVVGIRVVS
jgi:hypothetical protein